MDRLRQALRDLRPSDAAGAAGLGVGVMLAVTGIVLENQGAAIGATVRALGGILVLGGLGLVLFWEPRRRAAVMERARRTVDRYKAATAEWRWADRAGVAGVAIGLLLLPPALLLQILFGTVFGVVVIAPGIVLFWVGVALIIYARFQRRAAARRQGPRDGEPPR